MMPVRLEPSSPPAPSSSISPPPPPSRCALSHVSAWRVSPLHRCSGRRLSPWAARCSSCASPPPRAAAHATAGSRCRRRLVVSLSARSSVERSKAPWRASQSASASAPSRYASPATLSVAPHFRSILAPKQPQVQRDTTISSLSRALGVSWKSLWQLNPDLPHPDFSLQVLYFIAAASAPVSRLTAAGFALRHRPHGHAAPGAATNLPLFPALFNPGHQARTLADLSSTFGCHVDTLLMLNNDIRNASVAVPATTTVCIVPDACLARTALPAAASFRDQDWFRTSQTQRA